MLGGSYGSFRREAAGVNIAVVRGKCERERAVHSEIRSNNIVNARSYEKCGRVPERVQNLVQ